MFYQKVELNFRICQKIFKSKIIRMDISSKTIVRLLIVLFTMQLGFSQNQIPSLQKKGNKTQLIVNGKPFIILGGELGNSSATSIGKHAAILAKNESHESQYCLDTNLLGTDRKRRRKVRFFTH